MSYAKANAKETVGEDGMTVEEAIAKSGTDARRFFTTAYQWRYGKFRNTYRDAYLYTTKKVIPDYVKEFVEHIKAPQ